VCWIIGCGSYIALLVRVLICSCPVDFCDRLGFAFSYVWFFSRETSFRFSVFVYFLFNFRGLFSLWFVFVWGV
jgi:hypothetical protein